MSVTRTATNGSCMITTTLCAEQVAGFSHSHRLRNRRLKESGGSSMIRVNPLKAASSVADVTLSFILLLSRGLLLPWAQFAARLEMEWSWIRDLFYLPGNNNLPFFDFGQLCNKIRLFMCSSRETRCSSSLYEAAFYLSIVELYVLVNVGELISWFCCSVVDVSCFDITWWIRRITRMFQLLLVIFLSFGQSGWGSLCFAAYLGRPQLLQDSTIGMFITIVFKVINKFGLSVDM